MQQLAASTIFGSGLNYAERIPHIDQFAGRHVDTLPTAAAVATLGHIDFLQGNSCRADQALPIYLRDEVAWQKQPPVA
jgi:tRNA threonylcarbamoyladenosine biosynthesis protein TsaB